jgi:hypothetical protein
MFCTSEQMQGIVATGVLLGLEKFRLDHQFGPQGDHRRRALISALAISSRVRDDLLREGLDGMLMRAEQRRETMFALTYIIRIQELLQNTSREEQEEFFRVVITATTRHGELCEENQPSDV